MGGKISKRYCSNGYGFFSAKLFLKVPSDHPYKTCLLAFWNFKCKVLKKKIEI